jgi:hypothetical protein
MREGTKQSKTVRMPDELVAKIEEIAKREHRTFSQQVNLFLDNHVSSLSTDGTQVNMPSTAEERAAALERVR